jgi:hypothetical protein
MKAGLGKRIVILLVLLMTLLACGLSDLPFIGGDDEATETQEGRGQQIEVTAAIRSAPTDDGGQPPPPPPTQGSSGQTGSLPYLEDFSSSSSGWEVGEYDNGSVGYTNGEYFVTATSQGIFMWGQAMRNFSDIDITVTASQLQGPSNDNTGYGVMCRVRYDPQNDLLYGYSLRISGDGYYAIHKFTGSEIVDIVPWTTSPAIVLGNSSNSMRVTCDGSYLALYANGVVLAEANDSEFSSGDIAFSGTNYEEGFSEFRFDDLAVRSPDISGAGPPPGGSTGGDYTDDFSSSSTNWEIGSYDDGSVGYDSGEYFVEQYGDASFMWGQAGRNYSDVDISVDAYQRFGPSNDNTGYGVMCRVDFDFDIGELSGYLLWIGADQTYSIIKWSNDEVVTLVEWGTSSSINGGNNAVNRIRAVCDGNRLALYVNGVLLAETTDSELTSGDIAFAGTSFESDSSEFRFDNLELSIP